jgi:hypothetical protein
MSEHEELEPGMTPDEDDGEGGAASPDGGSTGPQSIRDGLKSKREAIGAKKWHNIDIPGYDGELVARFKRMRWEALAEIAERAEQGHGKRKALNGHADVIATAVEELLIRRMLPGGEEELTPMHELFANEFGSVPVRFDPRLADFLDVKLDGTPTARKVVFAVFNNDLAVTALHNELGAWMQSSKSEEDEDFTKS